MMPLGPHTCGEPNRGHFRAGIGLQIEATHVSGDLALGVKFELDRDNKVAYLQIHFGPFQFALGVLYGERPEPEFIEFADDPPAPPSGPLN